MYKLLTLVSEVARFRGAMFFGLLAMLCLRVTPALATSVMSESPFCGPDLVWESSSSNGHVIPVEILHELASLLLEYQTIPENSAVNEIHRKPLLEKLRAFETLIASIPSMQALKNSGMSEEDFKDAIHRYASRILRPYLLGLSETSLRTAEKNADVEAEAKQEELEVIAEAEADRLVLYVGELHAKLFVEARKLADAALELALNSVEVEELLEEISDLGKQGKLKVSGTPDVYISGLYKKYEELKQKEMDLVTQRSIQQASVDRATYELERNEKHRDAARENLRRIRHKSREAIHG